MSEKETGLGCREFIDNREKYLLAVERIAQGTGPVAVDAERASGFRYYQRAYLVQVFRRDCGTFLFDPPAIGSFGELNRVLQTEEWILHAASQDLPCLRELGLEPQKLFDTELAARLLGLAKVGLATVSEQLLGIHLRKEHSAADWSTRPLPASWLEYAALDVELLPDLRDAISELLEEHKKSEIAAQEFQATLEKRPKKLPEGPWRKLSGIQFLRDPQRLTVARELWLARDLLCQELDIAPGRMLPDSSVIAAAKALPATKRELAALPEFTGKASRSELERWWSAIETGYQQENAPQPIPHSEKTNAMPAVRQWAERNPQADARLKSSRKKLAELSEASHIPLENLLTPEYLRRMAWQPPENISEESIKKSLQDLGARQWQIAMTAALLAQSFVEANQIEETEQ